LPKSCENGDYNIEPFFQLCETVFRQEMERQRLAEWEKQRKSELLQHRQREQGPI
jgi:hypothetical protein